MPELCVITANTSIISVSLAKFSQNVFVSLINNGKIGHRRRDFSAKQQKQNLTLCDPISVFSMKVKLGKSVIRLFSDITQSIATSI